MARQLLPNANGNMEYISRRDYNINQMNNKKGQIPPLKGESSIQNVSNNLVSAKYNSTILPLLLQNENNFISIKIQRKTTPPINIQISQCEKQADP